MFYVYRLIILTDESFETAGKNFLYFGKTYTCDKIK